jgi:hypothetical protein
MGARMRSHHWSGSPLGDPEAWPRPLRMLVRMILNAKQPMFIAWGPDLAFLYNDDYPILCMRRMRRVGECSLSTCSSVGFGC